MGVLREAARAVAEVEELARTASDEGQGAARRAGPPGVAAGEHARAVHAEITAVAERSRRWAIRHHALAYIVAVVMLLSSIAAGVMIAMDDVPKGLTAALATLPAVMLTASTVFRFEQKSAWYWKKTRALEALLRKMRYQSLYAVEASRFFLRIEEDMEREWVALGTILKARD